MRWLLLLILLLSLLAPVRGDDILVVKISTDQKTYEAGERGVMSVTFTNNSGQSAEDINIEVRSTDFLFFDKTAVIESILYGSQSVQFKFQCKNLEDGSYPVLIVYSFTATSKSCQGGTCQKVSDKKTHELTIKNGEPRISLETNTLTVRDSKTVITFRNSDETAIDFQFQISCDLQMQYEQYIGYLLSMSAKEITVYGEPGEYQGSVEVSYRDRFGRTYEKSFLIKIVIEVKKEKESAHRQVLAAQNTNSMPEIRKIHINAAPNGDTPVSQYFAYLVMGSCFFLIGSALVVKLRNVRK